MSFLFPKVKKPPPPPSTPTQADASILSAGDRSFRPYGSMIGTGSASGLSTKATVAKRSLVGGNK